MTGRVENLEGVFLPTKEMTAETAYFPSEEGDRYGRNTQARPHLLCSLIGGHRPTVDRMDCPAYRWLRGRGSPK